MIKKTVFLMLALLCSLVFAQDQPKIAVYVTGDVPDNEKSALGTRMLASLVNSGRYIGIERSSLFLAEIEREQEKQRSGAIDDGQISELGKQFGVKYVCIAAITPAFGSFQVSARIVDVETAEVAAIGESFSPLASAADFTEVSDEVVRNMFGIRAESDNNINPVPAHAPKIAAESSPEALPASPEPTAKKPLKPSFWIGLGVDAAGAGIIAYGIYQNSRISGIRNNEYNANRLSDANNAAKKRNNAYIAGAAILLAGISIQIFF
jgi:hypothetical protein